MNDMTPTREQREAALEGMGCKRKRVEDIRFTQGKGKYVDDIKLPGMLHGDFVRSPYAHAKVTKIDATEALKLPGVIAVLTAEDLKGVNLAWMPTLAGDVQMVLADGKVLYQNQEVAFVVAEDRYIADDAVQLVEVEYEELPVLVDPFKSLDPDAPVLRPDLDGKMEGAHGPRKHHNHIFNWSVGEEEATDKAFAEADVTVKEMISYHRTHPSPLETCQCLASMDKVTGQLTVYGTFQAPHVVRTVASLLSTIPEHKIHVIAPDVGGGFGNKVGVYPGYVCAIVASIVTGLPVKWVEDRMENLSTTSFARDYHMTTEIAAKKDGTVTALKVHVLGDHGGFDACADPSKWPAGFFNIVTGSYDFPVAHLSVDGVYTNKAPGGVAYRCSFRVTEAAYCIERGMDVLAQKLGMDPADLRLKNFIQPEQFPYNSALGWEYDSGDYPTAMHKAMDAIDYRGLREEQKAKQEAFKRGETREIMGIGVSFFTEIVGAGPSKNCDILGVAMFDSAEIRIHPTGSVISRMGTKSQGQGHETTWAQIIATEIGIPASDITVEEGDTDTAPYGLGTYGSRSTPVAGAAIALAARKIRNKAQMIAAHMLEVSEYDLDWDVDGFQVKGNPERRKSMKEIAWAAYHAPPAGIEPGLEAVSYYDPPNMTYPFGAYFCVMDIDVDTGVAKTRRFYALDDCGTRINPMIIEGQVHGGLTEAFAIAMGQEISYDAMGNVQGASFMDFFLPTAVETPHWETDFTVTPSPHHPIGAKGVGESPNVGGVPAFSNAVNDAFGFLGATHIQMPHDAWRLWKVAKDLGAHG
ncbi:carbon-monoxide dehydrogenase large subunit [Roseibium sp. CAU 1637]|uniref:Carbon monoxide dehydrogenase large chain n=1 Tax=Roseibium limicola TaxID=2816037 RepID=A0A939EMI1_9HYPH|nr:aerobic carbon-monoxide dehydrogenase large subunit [Roseibium limicola]MBO0345299.1 carbon-monoxide dehydrogenase large subunit [Roseibium limicola]